MKENKKEEIEIPFATDVNEQKKAKQKEARLKPMDNAQRDDIRRKGEIVIPLRPIRLTTRALERAVFIIIILFLLSLLILKPSFIFWGDCSRKDVEIKEGNKTGVLVNKTVNKTTEQSQTTKKVETPKPEETEKTEETEETGSQTSGEISLTIGKIGSTKISNSGKITSVSFVINNQKEDFKPLAKVYVFDEDSSDIHKTRPRETVEFGSILGVGKSITKTVSLLAQFPSVEKVKTVKVRLYNADTEDLIKEGEKAVMIE